MCFFGATILKIGILRIVICVPNPSFYEICVCFFNGWIGVPGVCLNELGIGAWYLADFARLLAYGRPLNSA